MALTEKQERSFRLAGEGLSYDEIAASLGVHPNTVKGHLKIVKQKLGVPSKRGLVRAAREYFEGER